MNTDRGKPIEILMVEDNPGDVRLTKEAMRTNKMKNNIRTAENGVEALAFLRREGKYSNSTRPDLILLDLNLPKKDGLEVLKEIKDDTQLKRIPVVVLTTSKAEEDIVKSYNLHANCFITKPIDLQEFATVVRSIEDFWLEIVRLPKE